MTDPRRNVPRTDAVLADPLLRDSIDRLGRERVKSVVKDRLDDVRRAELAPGGVVAAVLADLPTGSSSLRAVLNATGVVVHTNLGRAPLSSRAVEAVVTAAGSTDVELDLATGRRGPRGEATLSALTSACAAAEAAHVVNNGAAALGLAAAALAGGRSAVIARGELVEIGDGFRIPELVESFGVRLREVGTTNRVRVEDYAAALGRHDDPSGEVGMILKVHPSNFRVEGFTSSVDVAELAELGRTAGVPVVADIGSGLLTPHPRLPEEPDATTTLSAGADLVTASGDKLLGGPQCGLLLGRADLVQRLRRHPMARALRVDKLTLAALEATLTGGPTPVARALSGDPEALLARAEQVAHDVGGDAVRSVGRVGGGGAPGVELASAAVALPPAYAAPLRTGTDPVVGHVHDGRLLLDLLTVAPEDDARLVAAVRAVRAVLAG